LCLKKHKIYTMSLKTALKTTLAIGTGAAIFLSSCASNPSKGIEGIVNDNYNIGDKVTVMMDQSLGTWAVMFGYVFPFLVLLFGLIVFTQILASEGIAGLLALSLLAPYYGILYLSRKQMDKVFQFKIIG